MVNVNAVELLKVLLKREVEVFCRRHDPLWAEISDTLTTIRQNNWRAVFFGGTLRSLLLSRLVHRSAGRPRDVDIVIQGPPPEILRKIFEQLIARETRFGGLQLRHSEWIFDVWPLERTWAIVEDRISHPDFADLPRTTFLNVEAAAIDVWPEEGQNRQIYSGDDQFFQAIIDRVVEINRPMNPFPELCVVRSLVMTSELGFRLGNRLAHYIAQNGIGMSVHDLEAVQEKHYGHVRLPGDTLQGWIRFVADALLRSNLQQLWLPSTTPLAVATDDNEYPYEFLRTVERWHHQRSPHPA